MPTVGPSRPQVGLTVFATDIVRENLLAMLTPDARIIGPSSSSDQRVLVPTQISEELVPSCGGRSIDQSIHEARGCEQCVATFVQRIAGC